MYYRSRGTRQFVIYLLVVMLALIIGLMLGAAYPDQINRFFPSIGDTVAGYFDNLFASTEEIVEPLENMGAEETIEYSTTPLPTEVPVPISSGSDLLPPRPTPETCVVKTGYENGTINIRSGPGHNYPVIGIAYEGDIISLTGPENEEGWAPILTEDGLSGYFYLPFWCE